MNPFEPQPGRQPGRQPTNYFAQQSQNPLDNPAMFERAAAPARPPSRLRKFAVSAAVSVATAACCGGINALFDDDDDDEKRRNTAVASTPTPTPSPTGTTPSSPSAPPPTSRSVAPPSPTANPLDAVGKGDCLKNTGTASDPEMVPTTCAAGTYQVLKRIYGTIDANQCQSVSGATTTYTVTYYRNGITQVGQSYVFCLKKR